MTRGTRTLHANYTRDALCVWGECATMLAAAAANGERIHESGAHPFAMTEGDLAAVLAEVGAEGQLETIELRLPMARGLPAPSARAAHGAGLDAGAWRDADAFGVWSAVCAVVDARALGAIEEWAESREGVSLGQGFSYFALCQRFASSLLAEERFVPMLLQDGAGAQRGGWSAWYSDEATAHRVGALLDAMPACARAGVDERGHGAWAIVEAFLNSVIDARCRAALARESMIEATEGRSAGDPHVAWLSGLLGESDETPAEGETSAALAMGARRWVGRLDERGAEVGWRLFVQVDEPAPEEGRDAWRLVFGLASSEDDHVRLVGEEIWALAAEEATVDGRRLERPHETLLEELGRASRVSRALERALKEAAPTHIELDDAAAHLFLREERALLTEQGIAVDAPLWWGGAESRIGLTLFLEPGEGMDADASGETHGSGGAAGKARLGLDALVKFSWRVAVGETALTVEDLERLESRKSPLVQVGGRWVEALPADIAAAKEMLLAGEAGRMTLGEAMRLALADTAPKTNLAIQGVEARGWIADLIPRGEGGQRVPDAKQPASFVGELRPYQERGLSWLLFLESHGLGGVLADDMGLGKTIQMLALLLYERDASEREGAPAPGPTLLIAPTSVVGNWRREAGRFAPKLKVIVHHGLERTAGDDLVREANSMDLVVTTYTLAHRDADDLNRVGWQRVVLDEAQKVKNPATKQSKAVRSIEAPARFALTGTPIENRLSDLWAIMDFCNPGLLGSHQMFRRRFASPIEKGHDDAKRDRLRRLVRPFLLRRVKSDPEVTIDLPEKIETKEICQLTPEQATLYERAVERMLSSAEESEGLQRRGLVLAGLTKLKQICNHPGHFGGEAVSAASDPARSGKCARLVELLEEVRAEGDQALVFTQFRKMGDLLASMLRRELDCEAIFLHGGTPQAQRDELVERFQRSDGGAPIFILSLKAGGVGMNLTAASHVFHFDRWWNPAVENQATDRAHRIGQTRTVQVHKFIVAGTLEERIDEMIEEKKSLADDVIGTGEQWLTEMSTTQLRDVLALRRDAVGVEV